MPHTGLALGVISEQSKVHVLVEQVKTISRDSEAQKPMVLMRKDAKYCGKETEQDEGYWEDRCAGQAGCGRDRVVQKHIPWKF